jgi:hypothetical protein
MRFVGLQLMLATGLPVLGLLVPPLWTLSYSRIVAALCAAAVVGFALPSYLLDKRRVYRKTEIDHGLPDALDLMVVCVEAGLGLTASLTRVAREFARTNPVLSSEFELVHLECRAGKGTTDALRAMAERTDVADALSGRNADPDRTLPEPAWPLAAHPPTRASQALAARREAARGSGQIIVAGRTVHLPAATLMVAPSGRYDGAVRVLRGTN